MARTPIHPGEHLADELRELDISAAELARQLTCRSTGSPESSMASAASRQTRRCVLATGLASAQNFG